MECPVCEGEMDLLMVYSWSEEYLCRNGKNAVFIECYVMKIEVKYHGGTLKFSNYERLENGFFRRKTKELVFLKRGEKNV